VKLLPLLLEWDVRQGPTAGPSSGVQFRPTGIRKVSGRGVEDSSGDDQEEQQHQLPQASCTCMRHLNPSAVVSVALGAGQE
jgi:hypothetical protein